VAAEWAWIELLLGEMLAYFCRADPGSMYVITQHTSASTVIGWLQTLIGLNVQDAQTAKVIQTLLQEVDAARAERNAVVHGVWRAAEEPSLAYQDTFDWNRQEVARHTLWSLADIEALVDDLTDIQLKLANLGIRLGFLKLR
jgi:hypothetical protein